MLQVSLAAVILSAILLFFPSQPPAYAASGAPSILLTLDGIKGEYSDSKIKDAIPVDSYGFGAEASLSSPGGQQVKPSFSEITLAKRADAASLPLLKMLATGKHVKDGYLYFQTRGADRSFTYMIVHLSEIVVTDYEVGGSSEAGLEETLKLQAKSMLFKYTMQKPDGSAGPTSTVSIGSPAAETSVLTKYHFEPIMATTAKGYQYIQGFTVTLQATASNNEATGTKYRINGGAWTDYTGPFAIYAEDTHTVEYYSTDEAGDVESPSVMNFDDGTFAGSGSY